jgi:hypothetical protein
VEVPDVQEAEELEEPKVRLRKGKMTVLPKDEGSSMFSDDE